MSSLLQDLHPIFQPIARGILDQVQERLGGTAPGGSTIRAAVTFRSMSDQAAAKAAGLSQVNLGWHQFGFAFDVAIIGPNGDYIADGQDARYKMFGEVAQAAGCIWGGSWAHPDWDHCQLAISMTPLEYAAWLDAHRIAT